MGGLDNPAMQLDDDERVVDANHHNKEIALNEVELGKKVDDRRNDDDESDFEDLPFDSNVVSRIEDALSGFWSQFNTKKSGFIAFTPKKAFKLALFLLYNAYFIYSIHRHASRGLDFEWCDGFGFLLIITAFAYGFFLYFKSVKPLCHAFMETTGAGKTIRNKVIEPGKELYQKIVERFYFAIYLAVFVIVTVFVVVDSIDEPRRIISYFGLNVLIFSK